MGSRFFLLFPLLIVTICCHAQQVKQKITIDTYPLPAIYQPSRFFAVKINGVAVSVIGYTDKYDYATYSQSKGKAEVEITVIGQPAVVSVNISPQKLNIASRVTGNKITFIIEDGQYLIIRIDRLRELVLCADKKETGKPSLSGKGVFNVLNDRYKADGSGKTMATAALQQAIDDAATFHNGIVYVPAGVYLTGNLVLKSNMSLYLEGGAVLLFSGLPSDYAVHGHKISQKRDITWWLRTDSGTHDVKIYGRGILDGNGKYATETHNFGCHILVIAKTKNFVLDGPVIRNSGAWAVIPARSEDVLLQNFKLFNRFDMGENDGVDVVESKRVVVKHAIGIALDDPFSAKTWNQQTDICRNYPGQPQPQKDILFEDLISWTYCYGYKIGQGVMQPQSRLRFRNCVVYDAAVGIGIHHKWGTSYVNDVVFDGIDIERLSYQNDDHRTWLVLLMQNGDKKGSGPVSNIAIKNVLIRDKGISPGKIRGLNAERMISGVRFSNIMMRGERVYDLAAMNVSDTVFCKEIVVE